MTRRSRGGAPEEVTAPCGATVSRHAGERARQRGVPISRDLLSRLETLLPVLSGRPQRLYMEGSTFVVSLRDGEPVIVTAWRGR